MKREHTFKTHINWTGNRGSGTMDYRGYDRDFTIKIDGKNDILGSSDSAFNGDKTKHNPEDLLLSSVSSCHMLWYLHLCSDHGIIVLEYTDHAEGIMEEEEDGSGRFVSITLTPKIVIQSHGNVDTAIQLHEKAHKMCFIANSLNCRVDIRPEVKHS